MEDQLVQNAAWLREKDEAIEEEKQKMQAQIKKLLLPSN